MLFSEQKSIFYMRSHFNLQYLPIKKFQALSNSQISRPPFHYAYFCGGVPDNKLKLSQKLVTKNRYLDLPERLELPERLPKYRKDQRIIGKY